MLYCIETSPKKLGNSPLLLVPSGHHRGDGNDSQEITRQTPFSYIRGGLTFLSLPSTQFSFFLAIDDVLFLHPYFNKGQ